MAPRSMMARLAHHRPRFRIPSPLSTLSTLSSRSTTSLPESTSHTPEPPSPEPGTWTCCICRNQNPFSLRPGKHPVGRCVCTGNHGFCSHKPCEKCRFSGVLRHFVPIQEPLVVAMPGEGTGGNSSGEGKKMEEIPYGVICGECGLSWRATEVDEDGTVLKKRYFSHIPVPVKRAGENGGKEKGKSTAKKEGPSPTPARQPRLPGLRRSSEYLAPPAPPFAKSARPITSSKPASMMDLRDFIRSHHPRDRSMSTQRSISDPVPSLPGNPKHAGHPSVQDIEVVRGICIRFTSIKCSCGCVSRISTGTTAPSTPVATHVTTTFSTGVPVAFPTSFEGRPRMKPSSFTFRILEPEPRLGPNAISDDADLAFLEHSFGDIGLRKSMRFGYEGVGVVETPKSQWLIDQGHDTPILTIGPRGREKCHPNPLRSNAVNPVELFGSESGANWTGEEGGWI